jgi:hypothetical protein
MRRRRRRGLHTKERHLLRPIWKTQARRTCNCRAKDDKTPEGIEPLW